MITAIPLSAGRLSPHFGRADTFALLAEDGQVVAHFPNPVAAGQCGRGNPLVEALLAHRVGRVLVCNIGQSMLDALLRHPLEVYRVPRGVDLSAGMLANPGRFERLQRAEDGKVSPRRAPPAR